ncbi:MAG: 16S rRNA (guanine(966)-N(2))-methyltransferase RsmD [Pseudomonadota bacterium]
MPFTNGLNPMRIVGGDYRGRPIHAPKGQATRPTTDRTREALFNVLAHGRWPDVATDLAGARVIDLYAGSGALGLEALSRGAGFCLFVETDAGARAVIRDNVEALNLFGQTRIHRRSAAALGKIPASAGGPFTLAFLDPPYGKGLAEPTIRSLISGQWLARGALIVLEQARTDPLPAVEGLTTLNDRAYGDTRLLFLGLGPFGLPPAP